VSLLKLVLAFPTNRRARRRRKELQDGERQTARKGVVLCLRSGYGRRVGERMIHLRIQVFDSSHAGELHAANLRSVTGTGIPGTRVRLPPGRYMLAELSEFAYEIRAEEVGRPKSMRGWSLRQSRTTKATAAARRSRTAPVSNTLCIPTSQRASCRTYNVDA